MGAQMDTPQLRPLSIGEIFDRGVTLLVRNWVPFAIIGIAAVLPMQIFDYLAATVNTAWSAASSIALLLISAATISSGAIVAQIYRKQDTDWRTALLYGLRKIPSILGLGIMMILVMAIPLLVVVGIPAGMGVFRFANPMEDIVAVLSALCGGVIFLAGSFASSYALIAMGTDQLRATDAMTRAFALFEQGMALRTFLFALGQQVIVLGAGAVGGALNTLAVTGLHSVIAGTAIETLLLFLGTVIGNVLLGVFYFDVAIRREGYDMQVALEAMPS